MKEDRILSMGDISLGAGDKSKYGIRAVLKNFKPILVKT